MSSSTPLVRCPGSDAGPRPRPEDVRGLFPGFNVVHVVVMLARQRRLQRHMLLFALDVLARSVIALFVAVADGVRQGRARHPRRVRLAAATEPVLVLVPAVVAPALKVEARSRREWPLPASPPPTHRHRRRRQRAPRGSYGSGFGEGARRVGRLPCARAGWPDPRP